MRRRRSPEKRKHIAGLLRVLAYTMALGVVCGALSVRAARAELGNRSIVVGRQMLELTKTRDTDVTEISLNGQPIFLGNALSKEPVGDVLGRFQKHCQENAAQSPEAWREAVSDGVAPKADSANAKMASGALRSGNDREGTVLCFVRSAESKTSVAEALKALGETGDLGALGSLRYVYAKKTEMGNTHILTAWTLSKFNLLQFVPEEGKDVPGGDFAELPRPENSQRIFSARIEGTPFGANVYRSDVAPDKVAAQFDEVLVKQGWFSLDTELDKKPEFVTNRAVGHLYEKDGVVLTLASSIQESKTVTTLGLAGVAEHASNRR